MFIKEIDLFQGLSPGFMNDLAELSREVEYGPNTLLIERGKPAEVLYILVQGRISLFLEGGGSIHYTLDTPGQIFGWSAIVEPHLYTASAVTSSTVKVLELDSARMQRTLERYPAEAYLVMKRLAGVISQRLQSSYAEALHSRSAVPIPSYG